MDDMTTVIGFIIPGHGDCPNIKLPKGWDRAGNERTGNWHECQLILVHDVDFKDQDISIATPQRALHAVHLDSSRNWRQQHAWLKQNGWNSTEIEEFSHFTTYPFIADICALYKAAVAKEELSVLQRMAQRFKRADQFRKLDTYAAWAILCKAQGQEQAHSEGNCVCKRARIQLGAMKRRFDVNDTAEIALKTADDAFRELFPD